MTLIKFVIFPLRNADSVPLAIEKLTLGIFLTLGGIFFIGYYFTELSFLVNIFPFPDLNSLGLNGKTFNMSLSALEEPKTGSKNAFYAQVLFFSMLVVGIGYIFFQVYKKVSSGDFASAPDAELIQKSIGEWSVQGVDVEKVDKALFWNKHGQMGDEKVVPASDIIEYCNLLLGMPLLEHHGVMLLYVRNVESYYEKYKQRVASQAGSESPFTSYETLQGYENIKAIEHFMSQKNVDLTTSIISIDDYGRKIINFDTKTIDYLYCERMSSLWKLIFMQNRD